MWKILASIVFIAILDQPVVAQGRTFGITTGGTKGTYYAVAQDIKKLVGRSGIKMNVLSSQGSLQNIYRVYRSPESQLGILQHDVLFWIRAQNSQTARLMSQKIKLVFPLYNEEVHIVARDDSGIFEFEQLSGKRVAIGKEGSGTSVTAENLMRIANVKPGDTRKVGGKDALAMLKSGNLDAMFYVAGAPVKLFVDDIGPEDNLHFVTIANKDIIENYSDPITLDGSYYPWTKDDVNTIAVKAVLVTFNYRRSRAKCQFVGRIASAIRNGIDELRRSGHPKWKSVDVSAKVHGWGISDCARYRPETQRPAKTPFQRFLDDLYQSRKNKQ